MNFGRRCAASHHLNYRYISFVDYAMQMEVPALSGDDNELELSCNIPSADDIGYDDDGNDPDHQNGVQVDNAVLG